MPNQTFTVHTLIHLNIHHTGFNVLLKVPLFSISCNKNSYRKKKWVEKRTKQKKSHSTPNTRKTRNFVIHQHQITEHLTGQWPKTYTAHTELYINFIRFLYVVYILVRSHWFTRIQRQTAQLRFTVPKIHQNMKCNPRKKRKQYCTRNKFKEKQFGVKKRILKQCFFVFWCCLILSKRHRCEKDIIAPRQKKMQCPTRKIKVKNNE